MMFIDEDIFGGRLDVKPSEVYAWIKKHNIRDPDDIHAVIFSYCMYRGLGDDVWENMKKEYWNEYDV